MKTIPLTQGKVAIVDNEDWEKLLQCKWYVIEGKTKWYAMRRSSDNGKRRTIYMHREILKPPSRMDTDHINGDGLDNRRSNLRIATRAQNKQNARSQRGSTSKYKGVCWNRNATKWQAQICVDIKHIYLGLFDNEEEAARAYDKRARELFREFALTNF